MRRHIFIFFSKRLYSVRRSLDAILPRVETSFGEIKHRRGKGDIMAFFGLTALGPQSSFQVSLADFSYLNVFTDKDIESAFNAVADKERLDYLSINQVQGTTHVA